MKTMLKFTTCLSVLALLFLTLGLGWVRGAQEAHAEGTVNVLFAWAPEWVAPLFEEFEKTTGIHVNSNRLSAGPMLDQLIEEKDNPQVDVVFGPGDMASAQLKKEIFEPYRPPAYDVLGERFKDPEGYWVAVAEGPLVFLSNKAFLQAHNLDPPSSWNDLLDPVYKGMIQIPDPRRSGTAVTRVFSILQIYNRDEDGAFDYMKQLRANVKEYLKSGNPGPVALGQAGAGITFISSALFWAQQGFDVVISFPKEGIATRIEPVSLVKGAPHPEAARKLIDWATSPAMQNLYVTYKINALPVHPDAKPEPSLAEAVKGANLFPIDNAFLGENRKRIVERWEKEVLPFEPSLQKSEEIASKIEDLVGIWESRFMGAVAYMQYEADGTFNLAYTIEKLKSDPIVYGTFWFEGTVFNTKDSLCPKGSYEVRVRKEGDKPIHLSFTVIDDPSCPGRFQDLPKGMARVEPSLQVSKKEEIPIRKLDEQYLIYFPKEYEAQQKKWPLLLFLHGLGERGNNLELVKKHGPPKLVEQGKDFAFIIVSPQCPEDRLWQTPLSIEFLDKVLNEITERYRIDEDRVYVTGLSLGGFGTWTLALAYPDRFAAIAPICGGGDPGRAESIKHLPVWVFHGAKDDVVSIKESQDMVDALEKVGGNVKFTVYPDAGHDVWTETYNNPELYEWFLQHRREQ